MPEETFTHSTRVATPRERIWAALQEAQTWASLGPIEEVFDEVTESGLISFSWAATVAGTRRQGTAVVAASRAPESIRLDLDSPELDGDITIDLEEDDAGTVMSLSLTARSKGMVAGMFWGVISEGLHRELPGRVERFASGF